MKLESIPEEFIRAEAVLKEIQAHGFEAYFVGGSVRDALLEKPIHDVDIATSAYPEEIKKIFSRTIDVGIEHGTVLILIGDEQYEVTTFRTESTYQDFRRPDEVTFVRSLKEDLKRRDFTINALAMTCDGEVIDLFDGMNDLKMNVIRAVGNAKERFHEDALRMMRGLRFASQLDFTIEEKTLTAIQDFHSLLGKISVERIAIEFSKLLLGKNRKAGLLPFVETECYLYCPGLQTYGTALLRLADLPDRQIEHESEAWALLVYILEIEGDSVRSFLKKWKLSNQLIQTVQKLVVGLQHRLNNQWQAEVLFQLGLDVALSVEKLLFYFGGNSKLEDVQKQYAALPIHDKSELAVSGNDLLRSIQKKPGRWLGDLIEELLAAVINGQVSNEKEALLDMAHEKINKE